MTDIFEAGRSAGEVWQGQSGRWFTKRNDGRVIRAKDPNAAKAQPKPTTGEHPRLGLGRALATGDDHAKHIAGMSAAHARTIAKAYGVKPGRSKADAHAAVAKVADAIKRRAAKNDTSVGFVAFGSPFQLAQPKKEPKTKKEKRAAELKAKANPTRGAVDKKQIEPVGKATGKLADLFARGGRAAMRGLDAAGGAALRGAGDLAMKAGDLFRRDAASAKKSAGALKRGVKAGALGAVKLVDKGLDKAYDVFDKMTRPKSKAPPKPPSKLGGFLKSIAGHVGADVKSGAKAMLGAGKLAAKDVFRNIGPAAKLGWKGAKLGAKVAGKVAKAGLYATMKVLRRVGPSGPMLGRDSATGNNLFDHRYIFFEIVKKDKRGYNRCYNDETGKPEKCPPKEKPAAKKRGPSAASIANAGRDGKPAAPVKKPRAPRNPGPAAAKRADAADKHVKSVMAMGDRFLDIVKQVKDGDIDGSVLVNVIDKMKTATDPKVVRDLAKHLTKQNIRTTAQAETALKVFAGVAKPKIAPKKAAKAAKAASGGDPFGDFMDVIDKRLGNMSNEEVMQAAGKLAPGQRLKGRKDAEILIRTAAAREFKSKQGPAGKPAGKPAVDPLDAKVAKIGPVMKDIADKYSGKSGLVANKQYRAEAAAMLKDFSADEIKEIGKRAGVTLKGQTVGFLSNALINHLADEIEARGSPYKTSGG